MRQLKLAVVLPILLCILEAFLWYCDSHVQPSVPSYAGMKTFAVPMRTGLDFPALLLAASTGGLWEKLWGRPIPAPQDLVVFLLWVAACWFLVGWWLDRRAAGKDGLKPELTSNWSMVCQVILIAFGMFTLLFSSQEYPSQFVVIVERALLQTWGVSLIGVPVLAFARRSLGPSGHGQSGALGRPARQPLSNFRLFIIVLGVFAALLVLGVVSGPTVPK